MKHHVQRAVSLFGLYWGCFAGLQKETTDLYHLLVTAEIGFQVPHNSLRYLKPIVVSINRSKLLVGAWDPQTCTAFLLDSL